MMITKSKNLIFILNKSFLLYLLLLHSPWMWGCSLSVSLHLSCTTAKHDLFSSLPLYPPCKLVFHSLSFSLSLIEPNINETALQLDIFLFYQVDSSNIMARTGSKESKAKIDLAVLDFIQFEKRKEEIMT